MNFSLVLPQYVAITTETKTTYIMIVSTYDVGVLTPCFALLSSKVKCVSIKHCIENRVSKGPAADAAALSAFLHRSCPTMHCGYPHPREVEHGGRCHFT